MEDLLADSIILVCKHNTRTQAQIMNNHTAVLMMTQDKENHRKRPITILEVIRVKGLQKTIVVTGLITETEMNIMAITSGHGMED